jgi:plastocyanin
MRLIKPAFLFAAAAAVALLGPGGASAQSARPPTLVLAVGEDVFVPNALLMSTFQFAPGQVVVRSGDQIEFRNQTDAPHTATIVDPATLPTSFRGALNCAECAAITARHLPRGAPPVPVLQAGGPGFDAVGDSVLFQAGQSATVTVTAPAGAVLPYLCALHPWMQGTIHVT